MIHTRSSLLRTVSLAAVTASLAGLAGCNPIGNGTGPRAMGLVINAPDGTANADTGQVYGCIRTGITASLFFENGTAADFTQRVTWSVAEVDQPFLTVSNFSSTPTSTQLGGVVTPGTVPAGTTRVVRVTARFSDFTDFIDITVNPKPDIQLVERNIGTNLIAPLPAATSADPTVVGGFRMAPQTSADLALIANLGGRPARIDSAATWTFDPDEPGAGVTSVRNPADQLVATISSDGLVTATTVDPRTLIARATLEPCNQSLATQVTVSPVRSVRLVPEFGAQPLIVPNTERYKVLAGFDDNGPEQDVSPFSTLMSSNTAVGNFIGSLVGIPSLFSSVAAGGPVTLTVTTPSVPAPTPPETLPARHAPTITQTVVDATTPIGAPTGALVSIELQPATLSAVVGSATVCPMRVVGTYASGAQQDITRRATFASSDTATAIASSVPLTAGQVGSAGLVPGMATITATVQNGTDTPFTDTAVFTSVAPSTTDPAPVCDAPFAELPGVTPAPAP